MSRYEHLREQPVSAPSSLWALYLAYLQHHESKWPEGGPIAMSYWVWVKEYARWLRESAQVYEDQFQVAAHVRTQQERQRTPLHSPWEETLP